LTFLLTSFNKCDNQQSVVVDFYSYPAALSRMLPEFKGFNQIVSVINQNRIGQYLRIAGRWVFDVGSPI
jgi:hypothetical protein